MKNQKFFIIIFFFSLFGVISAQSNQTFKVRKLSKFTYIASPNDTLILDKPLLKNFSGKMEGEDVQFFLAYYADNVENISKYNCELIMYKTGDSIFHRARLSRSEKSYFSGNITNNDNNTLYSAKYENNTLTIKSPIGTSFSFKENDFSFHSYDQLVYNSWFCKEDSKWMSDWVYEYSFEPSKYPVQYASLFSKLKDKKMRRWIHSIKSHPSSNSGEDFCFSSTDSKAMFPIYLDKNIFVTESFSYSYSGGAHGAYATTYQVYDVKKDTKLSISEVVNTTNKQFISLYKQKLKDKYKDMLFTEDFDSILPSENFYILPVGITFVHGIYSIAPYVTGEPSVFFSFEELKPYLKYNIYNK